MAKAWMHLRLRSAAAPFAAALIVLVFGAVSYWSALGEERSVRDVLHTQQILARNRDMLTRLLDAEAAERDFLITGDSTFLRPYHGADAAVNLRLAQLDSLVTDDSPEQERLDSVRSMVDRRFHTLDRRIALRRSGGFEQARRALLAAGSSHEAFDSLRQIVGDVEGDERTLLTARDHQLRARQSAMLWTVGVGTLAAATIGLLIALMLSRYAASAEAANESKARFLAQISHDLRTPLNAIIGYIDILQLGIHGPTTAEQQRDLERIQRSSTHLLSLVGDMLHFAKIEAGHLVFRLRPVPVHEVLRDVQAVVEPAAQQKPLQLDLEPCEADVHVLADHDKLGEILTNLLTNAIKFTPAGGSVRVACRIERQHVHFDVADSGPGIPSDRLESIFEPFVQLHTPGSGNHRGAGLGLAISRELARGMGGSLMAESVLGQGSTFTLSLKRAAASPARP